MPRDSPAPSDRAVDARSPRRRHRARRPPRPAPRHRSWPGTGGRGCRRSGSRPSGSPPSGRALPGLARRCSRHQHPERRRRGQPVRPRGRSRARRRGQLHRHRPPHVLDPGVRPTAGAAPRRASARGGRAAQDEGPLHLRDRPHPQYVVPLPGLLGAAVGRRPGTPRPHQPPARWSRCRPAPRPRTTLPGTSGPTSSTTPSTGSTRSASSSPGVRCDSHFPYENCHFPCFATPGIVAESVLTGPWETRRDPVLDLNLT